MFLAVAALVLVGCQHKAKDEVRHYSESAAVKAASLGDLRGTWKRVAEDGEQSAAGTVSFTADVNNEGLATINLVCAELSLDLHGVMNMMHAEDDIIFSNNKVDNGVGAPVFGRIKNAYNGEPKVIVDFTIEQRDGRFLKTFVYSFE